MGFLGDLSAAKEEIESALDATGLKLSGLSLSNDFNSDDPAEFKKQVDAVKDGIHLAAAVNAPNSRIFGGHIEGGGDHAAREQGRQRILDGLGEVVRDAEKFGVTLALENHGGAPNPVQPRFREDNSINYL